MDDADETSATLMQRVTAQAEVLVPLLRHLRAGLGEAEANALVYPVLRARMRDWIAELAVHERDDPIENWHLISERLERLFEGDVHWKVLEQDADRLSLDVTRCRFAQVFRQIGEPEPGAILTCELDDHIADLFAPDVALSRAETIMTGRGPARSGIASQPAALESDG